MAVKRLGKGLGALIPEMSSASAQGSAPAQPVERLNEIEVSKVKPNPFQPRETFDPAALQELKQSIGENGVIQPITVRQTESGYELIAGERRLRAVSELGHDQIPAYVLDVKTDQEMIELSLIENIQRENLNPIDEANGYQRLITECRLTQDEVAKKVGKDRSTVTNFLRLLKLPARVQKSLIADEITQGHARAFLALEDVGMQIELCKETVKKKLSVRQVEAAIKVRKKSETEPDKAQKILISPFIADMEDRLRNAFGTQVRIVTGSKGRGRIEIEYYNDNDIERILEVTQGK